MVAPHLLLRAVVASIMSRRRLEDSFRHPRDALTWGVLLYSEIGDL